MVQLKYIHVSFDVVDTFKPRVPKNRIKGEDNTIPRICVANRILDCINAMPSGPETLQAMQQLKLPTIIHAYYMQAQEIWNTETVIQYVPDAQCYGESWIRTMPTHVHRVDYLVQDPLFYQTKDGPLRLIGARFKRCPFSDNVTKLANLFHLHDSSAFVELMRKYEYAKVIFSMKNKFLGLLEAKTEGVCDEHKKEIFVPGQMIKTRKK